MISKKVTRIVAAIIAIVLAGAMILSMFYYLFI